MASAPMTTPSTTPSPLPDPVQPFAPDAAAAPRLRARMEAFSRAVHGGQAREVFLACMASRDALGAALDILGEATAAAQLTPLIFNNNGAAS